MINYKEFFLSKCFLLKSHIKYHLGHGCSLTTHTKYLAWHEMHIVLRGKTRMRMQCTSCIRLQFPLQHAHMKYTYNTHEMRLQFSLHEMHSHEVHFMRVVSAWYVCAFHVSALTHTKHFVSALHACVSEPTCSIRI